MTGRTRPRRVAGRPLRRPVRSLFPRRRSERGAAALELGLVFPVVVLLVFGLIQYGYQYWSLTTASATAREAARRMSVGHEWLTCAVPRAQAHADFPALGAVEVEQRLVDDDGTELTGPARIGDIVEVTVTFQSLHMGLPVLPVPDDGRVSETAAARIESLPATPLPCEQPGND